MTIEEAKSIVFEEHPGKKFTGYWEKDNKFIFAYKTYGKCGCLLPIVSANGEISHISSAVLFTGEDFGEFKKF